MAALAPLPPGPLLDIGAGTGDLALALRRRYPITVLAVVTVAASVYVLRDYVDNGLPVIALIALYTVFNLPFVIWLMRSYFDGVPRELEESAMVDGALADSRASCQHSAVSVASAGRKTRWFGRARHAA